MYGLRLRLSGDHGMGINPLRGQAALTAKTLGAIDGVSARAIYSVHLTIRGARGVTLVPPRPSIAKEAPMSINKSRAWRFLAALALTASAVFGQAGDAEISGLVKDPSGSV